MSIKDYYAILDVREGATLDELKSAKRRLLAQWHPDKAGTDPRLRLLAEEKCKEINTAYEEITAYPAYIQKRAWDEGQQFQFATGAATRTREEREERVEEASPATGREKKRGRKRKRPSGEKPKATTVLLLACAILFTVGCMAVPTILERRDRKSAQAAEARRAAQEDDTPDPLPVISVADAKHRKPLPESIAWGPFIVKCADVNSSVLGDEGVKTVNVTDKYGAVLWKSNPGKVGELFTYDVTSAKSNELCIRYDGNDYGVRPSFSVISRANGIREISRFDVLNRDLEFTRELMTDTTLLAITQKLPGFDGLTGSATPGVTVTYSWSGYKFVKNTAQYPAATIVAAKQARKAFSSAPAGSDLRKGKAIELLADMMVLGQGDAAQTWLAHNGAGSLGDRLTSVRNKLNAIISSESDSP